MGASLNAFLVLLSWYLLMIFFFSQMSGKMLRLALQFRQMIEEVKERTKREMEEMKEQLKREKEQAVLAARVETQVACTR